MRFLSNGSSRPLLWSWHCSVSRNGSCSKGKSRPRGFADGNTAEPSVISGREPKPTRSSGRAESALGTNVVESYLAVQATAARNEKERAQAGIPCKEGFIDDPRQAQARSDRHSVA